SADSHFLADDHKNWPSGTEKSFCNTFKMLVAVIIASHFPALDVLVRKAFTLFGLSPCGSHRIIGAAPAPLFPSFFLPPSFLPGSSATHISRQGAFILGLVGHAAFLW